VVSKAVAGVINLEGGTVSEAGTLEGAGDGLTVDGDVADSDLVVAENGLLTVSDGTHTATITLKGANHSASANFTLSQDSGTGTIVVDSSTHAFVAVMAAFAPTAGPATAVAAEPARQTATLTLSHGT